MSRTPNPLSDAEWAQLLRLIASGKHVKAALNELRRSDRLLYKFLRQHPERREQWAHVTRWGSRRKGYSPFAITEALREVSVSNIGFAPALRERGFSRAQINQIKLWTMPGGDMEKSFLAAKLSQERRLRDGLYDRFPTDSLLTRRGKRKANQALTAINKLRPLRFRKAEAAAYRAAYEQRIDPLKARLLRAKRRLLKEEKS